MKSRLKIASAIAAASLCASTLHAQVPADVAKQLRAIGNGVCVPETAHEVRKMIGSEIQNSEDPI